MSFFSEYMVQPTLVGIYVLAKNVLWDHYMPENPHVWLDVGTNVFAKLVSAYIVVEFIVPYTNNMATWIEPLIHGGINGGIKHQFINTDNLSALAVVHTGMAYIGGKSKRVLPPIEHYSFENGFVEGLAYSLFAKLTVRPFGG